MTEPKPHYDLHKYKPPGTGWYVLRNGHICMSGSKRECEAFINQTKVLT